MYNTDTSCGGTTEKYRSSYTAMSATVLGITLIKPLASTGATPVTVVPSTGASQITVVPFILEFHQCYIPVYTGATPIAGMFDTCMCTFKFYTLA